MKIIERRIMYMDDLRDLCVRNDWFTAGTQAEYARFLRMVYTPAGDRAEMTPEHLLEMALELIKCSFVDGYRVPNDILEGVVYDLCRICDSLFTVEDDDQ